MNNIAEYTKCSNCGACLNICSAGAISVNEEGLFYSIRVDADKCINCGLCKRVCPVNQSIQTQNTICAYGLIHNDADIVRRSSSAGAFSALAEVVMEEKGIVYGASYADDFMSVEICSTEECTLEELRRSKYVESKVGKSFQEVKRHLEGGRKVLYCGAPCQIAGLKRFLRKEYSNLLTCDFSCGGMPSHKMYVEWLKAIEKNLGGKTTEVNFRPKTYGWSSHCIVIKTQNGKRYCRLAMEDPYLNCFIGSHISVRDYCYGCDFADNHYSDIILADLWKFQSVSNIRNGNKGISLVITNSEKGEEIMQKVSKKAAVTVLDLEQASYNLVKKQYSEEFLKKRELFLQLCEKEGFIGGASKSIKVSSGFKTKVKYQIKGILGKV